MSINYLRLGIDDMEFLVYLLTENGSLPRREIFSINLTYRTVANFSYLWLLQEVTYLKKKYCLGFASLILTYFTTNTAKLTDTIIKF